MTLPNKGNNLNLQKRASFHSEDREGLSLHWPSSAVHSTLSIPCNGYPHLIIPSQSSSRCLWFAHRANLSASISIRRDRLFKVATVCPRASRVPLPSKLGRFAPSEMASSGRDMQILGEVQNIENVQPNATLQGKPGLLKQQNV